VQLGKLDVSQHFPIDSCKTGQFSPQSRQWVTSQKQNPRAKAFRADLTAERLREVLSYDSESGEFRWRAAPYNARLVGKVAGCARADGYRVISVDRIVYAAHRLAWLYVHGRFPNLEIDHIDRNRANNALSNLRQATGAEQRANSGRRSTSTSAFKGACKKRQKWRAGIKVGGRSIHLGTFDTPEAAHAAYMAAATKHFGAFANDGTGGANAAA
jgi:hypothetical protein